jgi:hypothetical protein
MQTTIKDRANGKRLVFRLKPSFTQKFLNLQKHKLPEAGAEVEQLPDDETFSIEVTHGDSSASRLARY